MLELSSNTINALGIFGRLSKDLEEFFEGVALSDLVAYFILHELGI